VILGILFFGMRYWLYLGDLQMSVVGFWLGKFGIMNCCAFEYLLFSFFLSMVPVLDFVIDIFDRLYLNGSGKIPFRVYLTGKVFRRRDRGLLKVDVSG
jgi:hypothetical protein